MDERTTLTDEDIRSEIADEYRAETSDTDMDDVDVDMDDSDADADDADA